MAEYNPQASGERRLKRFSTSIFFASFIRRDSDDQNRPVIHQAMLQDRKREAWSRPVRPDNHRGGRSL